MTKSPEDNFFTSAQLTTQKDGQTVPCYVCPICLGVFVDCSGLTVEHVPPKSMKGKPLCLTCRECNNFAGRTVDAALKDAHRLAEFLSPDTGPHKSHLIVEGTELRVIVERTAGQIHIEVSEKPNDPKIIDQAKSKLNKGVAGGGKFHIQYRSNYTRRLAEIGALKSAYLVAFAKFGYGYILQAAFNPLRMQLKYPDEVHIEPASVTIQNDKIPRQAIMLIRDPIKCLGIKWNTRLVILPWLSNTEVDFWKDYAERINQVGSIETFSSLKILDWPRGMEMVLDSALRSSA